MLLALLITATAIAKPKPKKKDDLVVIHTEFGDMTVLLYEETPLHKENFLRLAKAGLYDSVIWHRIIEDFMVQGGDVTKKEASRNYELEQIPAEFVEKFHHKKGALAAARTGDSVNPEKKSSSCQFYIVQGKTYTEQELTIDDFKMQEGLGKLFTNAKYDSIRQNCMRIAQTAGTDSLKSYAATLKDLIKDETGVDVVKEMSSDRVASYSSIGGTPHLDDSYTVFGEVVDGIEVIDKLAAVATGPRDKPTQDTIMTMELVTLKTKNITKQYGYIYPPVTKK